MITMHNATSPTIASQARAAVAELAMAARHGALGGGTVLAYTARLQKLLTTLAEFERHVDEATQEALDEARAREAARAAGTLVEFPRRQRFHTSGGTAA